MDKFTRRKLTVLAKRAESLAADIYELLDDPARGTDAAEPVGTSEPPISGNLTELQGKSRAEVALLLANMTSRSLGEILRELGGSGQEAKKPKGILMDRILWRLFDFQAGHDILRAEKNGGQQAAPQNTTPP